MAAHVQREMVPLRASDDVVRVRQVVREWAIDLGFGLVDQTKLVTAASELARNTVVWGRGGTLTIEVVSGNRTGLRLTFEDSGPGIPDITLAMKDGYSSGGGLGLGLGGSRRLVDEFNIESVVGEGTRVTITMWK